VKGLIRIYKADPVFWILLLILLFISGVCLAAYSSKALFFSLNTFHTLYLDIFFQNYTLLGDGVFSIAIFLILLLTDKITLALQVITGYLFSGILSQIIKHLVHASRPHAIISNAEYPYFIEGVTLSGMNSFPSGHTTSVFALAVLLALNTSRKPKAKSQKQIQFRASGISLLYLITAIITGYSRIYLGQHFLADVVTGALIGTLSALVVYWYLHQVKIEFTSVNKEVHMQLQ
jgi:membrane-associated phospholipid phosphatase